MIKTYLVVFAKCTGSNFSGHAPDVPGCVSVGDTLEEMQAMMREALELHLSATIENGGTIPEAKTTTVNFNPQDFEDVEYFIVLNLDVAAPVTAKTPQAA